MKPITEAAKQSTTVRLTHLSTFFPFCNKTSLAYNVYRGHCSRIWWKVLWSKANAFIVSWWNKEGWETKLSDTYSPRWRAECTRQTISILQRYHDLFFLLCPDVTGIENLVNNCVRTISTILRVTGVHGDHLCDQFRIERPGTRTNLVPRETNALHRSILRSTSKFRPPGQGWPGSQWNSETTFTGSRFSCLTLLVLTGCYHYLVPTY